MKNQDIIGIILAAGKGTRMRSKTPKVLHELLGRPLIEYPIRLLNDCGAGDIIVVIGHGASKVLSALKEFNVLTVIQGEQLGTGHAVMCARDLLVDRKGHCLIICGDMPLFKRESIGAFIEFHQKGKNSLSILSTMVSNPYGYGRIIRSDSGEVLGIVEEKDASFSQRSINEINTGTYLVENSTLLGCLESISNENVQGEYYLTDIVKIARARGESVGAFLLEDSSESQGVNSRQDLARAERILLERLRNALMSSGVTMVMPETIYVEYEVVVENDVVIGPFCVLKGKSCIKTGARIGAHTYIEDSVIGEGEVVPPFSKYIGRSRE